MTVTTIKKIEETGRIIHYKDITKEEWPQYVRKQFKDNNAMLKLVLQKGARELENTVTQTLVGRLNDNEDVEGVVDVIASRDKWYARNKKQLRAMLEGKMPEDYDSKKNDGVELTELQEKIKGVLGKL